MHKKSIQPIIAAVLLASTCSAQAVLIGNSQGGTEFPQGSSSFADAVAAFNPVIKNNEPGAVFLDPTRALGVPNYATNICPGGVCPYVSLGDGGSITLHFIDNRLTGSSDSRLDLWIFEVGPDVEATFVEISADGAAWSSVGKVSGSTRGVDIDAFGFGTASRFAYVRLTDDSALGGQTGSTVGADIDAVGAISSVATIPEPSTWALVLAGLGFVGAMSRRRRH